MSTVPSSVFVLRPLAAVAKQVPTERTHHGDTVTDPYAWLADPKDPEVIAYLEAENAYTEALTAGLADLRSAVFDEIKARTQETDLSVPVRKGNWWRYSRTVEGQQYSIHCRRRVRDGEVTPPMPEDGKPLDGEEVLLDGNELAAGQGVLLARRAVGQPRTSSCSPTRPTSPATSGTRCGSRTWRPGETLADEVPDTYYGCAWSLDGSALFYVTVDEAWRPYRVWRHMVGTPDVGRRGGVRGERREVLARRRHRPATSKWLMIHTSSKLTSEVWLLDAAAPGRRVHRRRAAAAGRGVRRRGRRGPAADPAQRRGAENFELASAPLPGAGDSTRRGRR